MLAGGGGTMSEIGRGDKGDPHPQSLSQRGDEVMPPSLAAADAERSDAAL